MSERSTSSGETGSAENPIREADQGLQKAPAFSIRQQINLALVFYLIAFAGIIAVLLVTSHMVEDRVALLKKADICVAETRQTRLFEERGSVSETDFERAIESLSAAKGILLENRAKFEKINGKDSIAAIVTQIDDYESGFGDAGASARGRELVSLTEGLAQAVGKSTDDTIILSRWAQICSLIVFFALFVAGSLLFGRRVLVPLGDFLSHSEQVARGEYSRIIPSRRHRDEFSDLSLAVNDMIAELERRQEMLVETHKLSAMGTLTAGVAHELNNPINNISLTTQMLLEDFGNLSDEERLDMINDLLNEIGKTKRIVHNLLDFTRESENKMEPLALGDVVKKTLALVGNHISIAGIQTDLQIMPNLPQVHGDRQQLEQMVLNLILNAVDVTPKGGRIQILVIPDDEPSSIAIKVTDYGPGIPDQILESIFDPFFTTKPKGVGLGLFICQGISVKHGGHISVETKLGVGSSFLAHMPATVYPVDLHLVEPS